MLTKTALMDLLNEVATAAVVTPVMQWRLKLAAEHVMRVTLTCDRGTDRIFALATG